MENEKRDIVERAYELLERECPEKADYITNVHKEVAGEIIDVLEKHGLFSFAAAETLDFCKLSLKLTKIIRII